MEHKFEAIVHPHTGLEPDPKGVTLAQEEHGIHGNQLITKVRASLGNAMWVYTDGENGHAFYPTSNGNGEKGKRSIRHVEDPENWHLPA